MLPSTLELLERVRERVLVVLMTTLPKERLSGSTTRVVVTPLPRSSMV